MITICSWRKWHISAVLIQVSLCLKVQNWWFGRTFDPTYSRVVLHPVLNIMGFCPYFVPSPGMPWQESVLLDRCEERNRGGEHHLRFCEHSHQDTRCRGCRWCRWCQAGRFRRTWNCEIGYIDITSQPELSRPYISLQWCNDARMVLTVEEWAWRMFRSLRPQCRKGWKTVRRP